MEAQAIGLLNRMADPENSIESAGGQTELSFHDKLAEEESKLEKKQNLLLSTPWAYLQSLLSSLQFSFDLKLSPSPIERDMDNFNRKNIPSQANHDAASTPQSKTQLSDAECGRSPSPAKLSYAIDQNTFVQNLLSANKYAFGDLPVALALFNAQNMKFKSIDMALVVDELVDRIKMVKEGEKVSLSLSLKPDDLGEMLISVSMKNGSVFISIVADQKAGDIIEANRASLEESLKRANINLGSLDISSGGDKRSAYVPKIEAPGAFDSAPLRQVEPVKGLYGSDQIDPYIYGRLFGFIPSLTVYSKA